MDSSLYPALKAHIVANTDPLVIAARGGGVVGRNDTELARLYNLPSSFTVWKTNTTLQEVGDKLNGAELAGLTSLNHTRLLTVITLSQAGINPSLPDRRAFFDDIFSGAGGATTRANLLALWKRFATVAERIYVTGTGTDAVPGNLTFEGEVSMTDIGLAMNQP
jgi:hypothetical protein